MRAKEPPEIPKEASKKIKESSSSELISERARRWTMTVPKKSNSEDQLLERLGIRIDGPASNTLSGQSNVEVKFFLTNFNSDLKKTEIKRKRSARDIFKFDLHKTVDISPTTTRSSLSVESFKQPLNVNLPKSTYRLVNLLKHTNLTFGF